MPNINIILPDELHKKLRLESARKERSIKDLVITILQDAYKNKKTINKMAE